MYKTSLLSYIEIWENVGDSTNVDYQRTILSIPDDHEFHEDFSGEIIRINRAQCNAFNP